MFCLLPHLASPLFLFRARNVKKRQTKPAQCSLHEHSYWGHILQELPLISSDTNPSHHQMHNLCHEYCEDVAREIVTSPGARLTAAIRKALMNLADLPNENIESILNALTGDSVCTHTHLHPPPLPSIIPHHPQESKELVKHNSDSAGYDIIQTIAGAVDNLKSFGEACRAFLKAEQERVSATRQLMSHQDSLEGKAANSQRLSPGSIGNVERAEYNADVAKADAVGKILEMVKDAVPALAEDPFVKELRDAEVVTGAVPRSSKSGKALTQRILPMWEAEIVVSARMKEQRALLGEMRQHLIEGYNTLCKEHLHRVGPAADSFQIDQTVGQRNIEEILKRFRSSLLAMKQLRIYETDQIAPLRPEIISEVSLPVSLSEQSSHKDDVVVGAYMEDDRCLPLAQRCNVSPETARVGLSYFQPLSLLGRVQRREGGVGFNLTEFCNQAGVSERSRDSRNVLTQRKSWLTSSEADLMRETVRRDPAVAQVFTACVERIIERGAAHSCFNVVGEIFDLAYRKCHLWPSKKLNNALLTAIASEASDKHRTALLTLINDTVKTHDKLVNAVRASVGVVGVPLDPHNFKDGKPPKRAQLRRQYGTTFKRHLAQHPVLRYTDTGVDEEFYALYIRSKPWLLKSEGRSDAAEALKTFKTELKYLKDNWKASCGVARGVDGMYVDVTTLKVETVTAGDVPPMAARWEERLRHLTDKHHTYDAILQVAYDEIAKSDKETGTAGNEKVNPYTISNIVTEVIALMERHNAEPAASTFSLLLALSRRLPNELAGVEEETLARMKKAGKAMWWQWFEEL